jgi:hypothetical protein
MRLSEPTAAMRCSIFSVVFVEFERRDIRVAGKALLPLQALLWPSASFKRCCPLRMGAMRGARLGVATCLLSGRPDLLDMHCRHKPATPVTPCRLNRALPFSSSVVAYPSEGEAARRD